MWAVIFQLKYNIFSSGSKESFAAVFEDGYGFLFFRGDQYFQQHTDRKEQADFLKDEYGIGGRTPALAGSWRSHEEHGSKGMKLSKGSIMEPFTEVFFKWPKVAERIQILIDTGRFFRRIKESISGMAE